MTDDRVREIAPSDDLIAFAIKDSLGERCASFDPDCYTCQAWQQYDRAIASLPAPVGVPEGWKLVPVEPIPEMLGAFWRVKNGHHYHDDPVPADTSDYAAYSAMLSASPPPPQSDEIETLRARVKELEEKHARLAEALSTPLADKVVEYAQRAIIAERRLHQLQCQYLAEDKGKSLS